MIAALLWLALALQVTPELKRHVELGLAAKRSGDLDTAVREFLRASELAPELAATHVNLGAVYNDRKDYEKAIGPLRKALELNPDLPGVHGMLGIALLAQGQADESIPHLERAGKQGLLGVALLETNRPRDAVERLEAALIEQPEDPDLLYYLGQAHALLSKQALELLTAKHPDSARSRQLRGEAALALGNREAAEQHLRSALEVRPDLRGVHLALGELYLASGDYETAEREFRQEPGSAFAAYKLGVVLLQRGDTKAALLELERSNRLKPDMPETLIELGRATAAAGNLAAAEALFRRLLEQEKESSLAESAHFQLAQIYRTLKRSSDADREMKRFHEIRTNRR